MGITLLSERLRLAGDPACIAMQAGQAAASDDHTDLRKRCYHLVSNRQNPLAGEGRVKLES